MKNMILPGTALVLLLGAPLQAQDNHYGLSINLAVPTGALAGTNYPGDASQGSPSSRDTYDVGGGAEFTMSFPVDKAFALRLSLGGQSFTGTSKVSGYAFNLTEQLFSVGAQAQFFLAGGNAYRQSGTYLLAGAALDFERFDFDSHDGSYWNSDDYSSDTLNKTRVGAVVGIGHSFRPAGGMRWFMEGAFHKTLTQTSTAAGDPPAADFVRFSFGVIL